MRTMTAIDERLTAPVSVRHPEQGWSLLINGVVLFDDGGALLPTGESLAPPVPALVPAARAA